MKKLLNKIKEWIAVDGLLHILVSYAIVVTFALQDIIAGLIFAVGLGFMKEAYDVSFYKAPVKAVVHDAICDVIGILIAVGVWYLLH